MSYIDVVILSVCIFLIQNCLFSYLMQGCNFLNYKTERISIRNITLSAYVLNLILAIVCFSIYNHFLVPLNLSYFVLIFFSILLVIFLQVSEIIYKKLSFHFNLSTKFFLVFIISVCFQSSFSALLIVNGYKLSNILKFITTVFFIYSATLYVYSFIILKYNEVKLNEAVKDLPIALTTIAILAFVLFGIV